MHDLRTYTRQMKRVHICPGDQLMTVHKTSNPQAPPTVHTQCFTVQSLDQHGITLYLNGSDAEEVIWTWAHLAKLTQYANQIYMLREANL